MHMDAMESEGMLFMIEIEKPRIERIESDDPNSYGKFVVEPLERGFGQTLGNSLRRVLLNSLPGVAPTCVRIEGVQHEFSTVPGVKEDVTELILNLKKLFLLNRINLINCKNYRAFMVFDLLK